MKTLAKHTFISLVMMTSCVALVACDSGDNAGDSPSSQTPVEPGTTDPGTTDPGTTDPGTTDPSTPDPVVDTKHVVKMSVDYVGPKTGNLVVGLFTSFPPTAPPVAFTQKEGVSFPTNVSLSDVPAGTYFGLVVLDVAPFDPMTQGPEDLSVVVTVNVPNPDAIPVVITGGNEPAPAPEKSDGTFDVKYTGTQSGNLVVGFFGAWPPQGPPAHFTQEANAVFPQEVTVTDVEPGQYTVLVMLDAEPYDPGNAGPEDRMTTIQVNPPLAGSISVTIPDEPAAPSFCPAVQ